MHTHTCFDADLKSISCYGMYFLILCHFILSALSKFYMFCQGRHRFFIEFLSVKTFVATYTVCNAGILALPKGLLEYIGRSG